MMQVSLQKGYNVILKDSFESGLSKGYEYVHKGYVRTYDHFIERSCDYCLSLRCRLSGRVKKRAMSSFDRDKMMCNLSTQLDYSVSHTCMSMHVCMFKHECFLLNQILHC